MKSGNIVFMAAGILAFSLGAVISIGAEAASNVLLVLGGWLLIITIGSRMRRPADAAWLTKWVAIGFAAKLVGTVGRYVMVTAVYGLGDSFLYHAVGTQLASQWRSGIIPDLSGSWSFGTQIVEYIAGMLFAVFTPDMLGGFLLFSILAYLGQLALYAAFRRSAKPHQLKPYALAIFLFPTYAFWPSSIGKDALIVLALGVTAYLAARALEAFEVRWLLGLAIGFTAIGLIRIHITTLVVGAFVVAAVLAKAPEHRGGQIAFRRMIVVAAGLAATIVALAFLPDILGVDIFDPEERAGFTEDVERNTSTGETVVEGEAVSGPADIPGAFVHVLFRPLANEATELQHYFAAAETTVLLVLFLWKLPAIVRNLGQWRANPYLVFSTVYTLGFVIAFSAVRNLGIIARQRGQVLAFFLCFVFALGWEEKQPKRSPIPEVMPRTEVSV